MSKKLQNITPKNLRTFNLPMFGRSPFYQSIQVLADNNVTWLTASGELKDDLKPVYQSICGTGLDYNFVHLKITQDENYFYHNDRKLAKTSTYDEVYLMHGENEYQYGNSPKFGNYLKVRKNGKWGIISFKITAVEPSIPLQITEVLAVDYDAIELVESTYIKLEKEGLIGYFQINEKPKYTSLEKFYNYFARFTLPNGKNGWLTTDGNEYLDE